MDVLEHINQTRDSDPSNHRWFSMGLDIVRKTFHTYKESEICFSFNGGKDCTVVLHLIRAAHALHVQSTQSTDGSSSNKETSHTWPRIRVVYFDAHEDFPDVLSFIKDTEREFGFTVEHVRGFRDGLRLLVDGGVRAVLMGTRRTDPDGKWQTGPFAPTSLDWPPCMRVCPILDWPYAAVWSFLLGARLPFCSLYSRGYTSLGSPSTCQPNPALERGDGTYHPAWVLKDDSMERLGRSQAGEKRKADDSLSTAVSARVILPSAALIIVGDELLSGRVQDSNVAFLCTALTSCGVLVDTVTVCRDEEVDIARVLSRERIAGHRFIFVVGGLGPTHDDVTMAGVAASFHTTLEHSHAMASILTALYGHAHVSAHPATLRMAQLPAIPAAQLLYADGSVVSPPTSALPSDWPTSPEAVVRKGYPLLIIHEDTLPTPSATQAQCTITIWPGVPAILRRKWSTFQSSVLLPALSLGGGPAMHETVLHVGASTEAELAPVLQAVATTAGREAAKQGIRLTVGSYPANEDTWRKDLPAASSSLGHGPSIAVAVMGMRGGQKGKEDVDVKEVVEAVGLELAEALRKACPSAVVNQAAPS